MPAQFVMDKENKLFMNYDYYEENIKNFISVLSKMNKENIEESDKDIIEHIDTQVSFFEDCLKNDNSERAEKIKKELERARKIKKKLLE